MSLVAFDTLKYASRLEKSGFERKQAAELAEAQMEVLGELMQEKLATKEDLRIFKEDLQALSSDFETKIHECKAELQTQIHECKAELQTQIHECKAELQTQIHESEIKLQTQIHESEMKLQVQISQLSTSMKEIQNSLLRWMTTLFAGSVAALSFVMSAFKFLH